MITNRAVGVNPFLSQRVGSPRSSDFTISLNYYTRNLSRVVFPKSFERKTPGLVTAPLLKSSGRGVWLRFTATLRGCSNTMHKASVVIFVEAGG